MTVSLVGAGPGDPGLLTVRGLGRVRSCEVLVYDRLVSPEVVAEAPANALTIAREPLSQDEVNGLLVAYGREGYAVVRLKGGDPFVFGRGGEEALALAAAGVAFEIVPGVSSIAAVPSAASIPITHRGVSAQVTIAPGHDPDALDFACLARTRGTVVLFMGLGTLAEVARRLIAAGRSPETPAAAISNGTLPEQQVVTAPLAEIAAEAMDLASPALVVIGETVALREALLGAATGAGRARLDGG